MKNRFCVRIISKCFIISIKYKLVIVSPTYGICYRKAVIQVKDGAEIKFFPGLGDLEFGDIRGPFLVRPCCVEISFSLLSAVVSGLDGWYFFFFLRMME